MANLDVGLPSEGWVSVFRANTRLPCQERALVLGAMEIEHRVLELPDGCHLLAPAGAATRAREQLRLYDAENPPRLPVAWPGVPPGRGTAGIGGYAAVLIASFLIQTRYLGAIDWLSAGKLVAGRVREGEWWRAVTALTLHGDAGHLAGNLVFGAFFGYLAGQYLGSGVAWLAIVVAAAAGNLANAGLQAGGHRSIGASTAVFAALGLVAAHIWVLGRRFQLGWARRWSPVVGAVALLAYIGTGDAQTDIVAHLTGFLAGAAIGLLLGWFDGHERPRPGVQAAAGATALILLGICWQMALLAAP